MPGYQPQPFSPSWEYPRHYISDSKETSPLWLSTVTDGRTRPCTFIPAAAPVHFEPQPPFTPCLTPTSSIGDSSVSSPRLTVTPCEEERKFLPRVHRDMPMYRSDAFSDVHSSDSSLSSRCSTSPFLSEMSLSPKEAPTSFIRHRIINKSSSSTDVARPKKKARSSGPSFVTQLPASPDVKPDKLALDTTTKKPPSARSASSSKGAASRRRKDKTTTNEAAGSQPIKFRFVTVEHSAVEPSDSSSGTMDETDSRVRLEEHMEPDVDSGPFEHGPTEFPPRPYQSGESSLSPLQKKDTVGKIPASNLDFLPVLEARFQRLEVAIEKYLELRAEQALRNSQLPSTNTPPVSSRISSPPPSPRSP